jgi:NAD(P)-dependent dehydrogenase (short-subunit alcohol dehydrogenase family)
VASPYILDGKVALVTGASSGLGRQFALSLARAGAKVGLAARRTANLEELASEIEAFDGRALPFLMDVGDPANIRSAVEAVETELGPIGILVNSAGISIERFITDFPVEDYDRLMNTNVRGTFLVSQEVGRHMIRRGEGGKIVNIASILGSTVVPMLSVYCMSKAAVIQMTRALALEWARHNIQVNALAPGYIETEINAEHFQTEIGQAQISRLLRKRIGNPYDLDAGLLLLASAGSDFMTGSVLTFDDGQTLHGP